MAPSRFLVQWQRRKRTGFAYGFVYTWPGKRFNPGIGFEAKENYHGPRIIFSYGWLPGENHFLQNHNISFTGYNFINTATYLHETTIGMLQWSFEAKKGFSGNIAANWYFENIQEELTLGNHQATVPAGKYSFLYLSAFYATTYMNAFSANFSGEAGKFYDGWKLSLLANPEIKFGAGVDIGLTCQLDHVNFSTRAVEFTNHIAGIKALLTLTTRTSLSALIQYNTAVNRVISNIRFRYNPSEGNDFYLVYDETQNTNLNRELTTLPHCYGRTLLLKYTYTFRW